MTLLSDTFKQQSGGIRPCCARNSSLQPLVDPCSDHKSTSSPWMKNGTCRNAGWGDECICIRWGAGHFHTTAHQCDKKCGSGHPATHSRFYCNVLRQGKWYTTAARWSPQETSSGTYSCGLILRVSSENSGWHRSMLRQTLQGFSGKARTWISPDQARYIP